MTTCPICDSPREVGVLPWLVRCPSCGFVQSSLQPGLGNAASHSRLDEVARAEGLTTVRNNNFAVILRELARLRPHPGKMLEVGCGHGWFLEAAGRNGWKTIGIEPDREIASIATRRVPGVRLGMFPESVDPGETFDAVVFNDVFEHLPDVNQAMAACARVLAANGLLVINLPDARGILYRTAHALAHLRIFGPLHRLWQKDFPSPHLSYFTGPLLRRLAQRHGFVSLHGSRLQSVAFRGLWPRIRYDRDMGAAKASVAFAIVAAAYPLLRVLPSDIWFEIFEASRST
ncbi:MAG: class I SAM-dependent methyltransferase [Myxococcales bacterium]|nr:class I SAM-dependent methyltransferase [Myxococcales bacterium]